MQCAVWSSSTSSSIKNTKTKENAKGNAKSKYDAVRATYLVPHTHTLVQLQLQLHKLQGSWPQCGHNRSSAWRLNPPSPAGPSGQAQSIKRVKRRNAPGRMGAEGQRSCTGAQNKRSQLAVQALSVSLSLSLCVLLSFYAFFASALGVCLHVCGYRVFRCSSVLFFWPTRRAKMAAGHNTLAV